MITNDQIRKLIPTPINYSLTLLGHTVELQSIYVYRGSYIAQGITLPETLAQLIIDRFRESDLSKIECVIIWHTKPLVSAKKILTLHDGYYQRDKLIVYFKHPGFAISSIAENKWQLTMIDGIEAEAAIPAG